MLISAKNTYEYELVNPNKFQVMKSNFVDFK